MKSKREKKVKEEKQVAATQSIVAAMADEVSRLIGLQDYKAVAKVGASWGAYLLEEELKLGVSKEQVNFMPEAHIFKEGKLVGVALLDAETQEDLDKFVGAIFTREPITPTVVLLVNGVWLSQMAMKNGGRPSEQPDRVNAGIGTVYLVPNAAPVAQAGKPVFVC